MQSVSGHCSSPLLLYLFIVSIQISRRAFELAKLLAITLTHTYAANICSKLRSAQQAALVGIAPANAIE